ncbi:hypothetical protein ACSSS7_005212 [Eimeria intestinalis]
MGQDQSTVLNDENIDEAEARIRPRNKKVTTRQVKTVKRSAPDQFMGRVEVIDHIKPIRESAPGVKEELESYEGIMDLAAKLKEAKKKEEEPLELRVMDLPEVEAESVSESSEEETLEDRGVYHRDVSAGVEPTSVLSETAHPVAVEGECAISCTLRFRDESQYSREFPVHRIECIVPLAAGSPDTILVIPADLLGKFVAVKAYRRVEDQFERTKFGDAESGTYDPHVAGARTAKTQAPKQFVTVVSTAIVGPVLLAEDAATLILKALARGGFSCAVKLRDVLDSVGAGTLDLSFFRQQTKLFLRELSVVHRYRLGWQRLLVLVPLASDVFFEQLLDNVACGRFATGIAFQQLSKGFRFVFLQARLSRSTCESWYNNGNVAAVRQMVQDFLEGELASMMGL